MQLTGRPWFTQRTVMRELPREFREYAAVMARLWSSVRCRVHFAGHPLPQPQPQQMLLGQLPLELLQLLLVELLGLTVLTRAEDEAMGDDAT